MDNHEYELVHHGIAGMKWGIRRYQNKDGTLTSAGKKRYEKELAKVRAAENVVKNKEQVKAKYDRLNARKQKVADREEALKDPNKATKKEVGKSKPAESVKKSGPKSLSDMSDQELQQVVTRLNLEKRYNELNPKEVSKGRKFFNGLMDKVVIPAASEAGKDAFKKWLVPRFDDMLGNTKKPNNDTAKKKADTKPEEPKPKKEKKEKADTKTETPKKRVYEKPTFESKDTFIWDDDFWNTPAPTTRSSNDDFADLFGLPEPTKRKKKK